MPFHVTSSVNLPSILEGGLQPAVGPRSRLLGESRPAVYLFRDSQSVEDALMGWLGDELDEQELVIIQVASVDTWLAPDAEPGVGADFELVVLQPVPADAIEAVFDECWSPVTLHSGAACDSEATADHAFCR